MKTRLNLTGKKYKQDPTLAYLTSEPKQDN